MKKNINPEQAIMSLPSDQIGLEELYVISPVVKTLGVRDLFVGETLLTFTCEATDQMKQGAGLIQGGQLASMLDAGMALLVLSKIDSGQSTSTISMNVEYLAPAKTGPLYVEAHLTKKGRAVAFTEATIRDKDTRDIARATATNIIMQAR